MKTYFYSHIIETESLIVEIEKMGLRDEQKTHLIGLIESNLHHVILDAILSELSTEDKKKFLEHVAREKHEEIWGLLRNKVDNIEEKIKKAADDLKRELHEDIKEVKEKD